MFVVLCSTPEYLPPPGIRVSENMKYSVGDDGNTDCVVRVECDDDLVHLGLNEIAWNISRVRDHCKQALL